MVDAGLAFMQVSGLLGGFSVTILILLLDRVSGEYSGPRDWILGLFLLSAGGYIFATGIFANTTTKHDADTLAMTFTTGLMLFHLANLCLLIGLASFIIQLKLRITAVVAILLSLVGAVVVFQNIAPIVVRIVSRLIL